MKTYLKQILGLLVAATFVLSCNDSDVNKSTTETSNAAKDTSLRDNTATGNAAADNSMMKCMNRMMDKMKNVDITGDFDIDFANTMIEHHRGAIEMSEEELKSGKDEKMKTMAQQIINAQKAEIDELQSFLKKYKPSGMKHGEGELRKSMDEMTGKMNAMQMTGDADKDFATMMVSHHEQAVTMSKMQLTHGMSSELKKMAQKTIDTQNKEIREFRDWLNSKQ